MTWVGTAELRHQESSFGDLLKAIGELEKSWERLKAVTGISDYRRALIEGIQNNAELAENGRLRGDLLAVLDTGRFTEVLPNRQSPDEVRAWLRQRYCSVSATLAQFRTLWRQDKVAAMEAKIRCEKEKGIVEAYHAWEASCVGVKTSCPGADAIHEVLEIADIRVRFWVMLTLDMAPDDLRRKLAFREAEAAVDDVKSIRLRRIGSGLLARFFQRLSGASVKNGDRA